MATLTYTTGPASTIVRNTNSLTGVYQCNVDVRTTAPYAQAYVYSGFQEVKTLAKGDMIHALPYTLTTSEIMPIIGKFQYYGEYANYSVANPNRVHCGGKPDAEHSWTGDIGSFAKLPSTISPPSVPASDKAFLIGIANTKANADLRRAMSNLPMLIAERKQTAAYLLLKAKQLSTAATRLQKKDLLRFLRTKTRDRKQVYKDIANEHLGFLFGVMPIINDIQGAIELISKPKAVVITGRGRMAKVVKTESVNFQPGSYNPLEFVDGYRPHFTSSLVTETRYSARTSISVDVTADSTQLMRDLGFNPLAFAYDVVPLSFLSDFVSNLGQFIRALDPLVGVQFRTGNTTMWEETVMTLNVSGKPVSGVWRDFKGSASTVGSSVGVARALRVTRVPLYKFPDNSLHFVNNMTVGKSLILLSLAVQRYVKPLRSVIKIKPFRYKGKRPQNLPPINYR